MSHGPNPWQQRHWDASAAGNFIGGGAGSGLIVVTALAGAQGIALRALLLLASTLIAAGLVCVWLEIGRPLRALNVVLNPRTSWMSREALVALVLLPLAVIVALAWPAGLGWAALLALAFLYCQGRMLRAARGIPAWREPILSWLIVASGLTEGLGMLVASAPLHGLATAGLLAALSALLIVRSALWWVYRRRLAKRIAERARQALDGAGRWLLAAGTTVPLLLLVGLLLGLSTGPLPAPLVAGAAVLAGLSAWGAGAWLKYVLITRAAFNQGFALTRLPVRGVAARPGIT
ncbi:MAG: dimethyl sulfoxide reductase anchor subunit [Burkholderiales bacterium]|nr:dimethyl sulfoxide reductase anchor subunit [Burkholderiales bacterium]